MKTAAIFYQRDGYDTTGKRLMGRQSAGEGFLKALARYGTAESLYCFTKNRTEFEEFEKQLRPWLANSRSIRWIPSANPQNLTEPGTRQVAASGQASGQWRISLSPWRTISRKPSD